MPILYRGVHATAEQGYPKVKMLVKKLDNGLARTQPVPHTQCQRRVTASVTTKQRGWEQDMSVTQPTKVDLSGVYGMKGLDGQRVWVGEVAHPAGETPGELERRWDAFARLMFAHGVEPEQDDPNHTVVVDGLVTDRYRLREIVEDEA